MFYTELFWAMRMRQREMDWKDSRGALFLVMPEKEAGRVIGTVSLSNINRGVFQGCHLATTSTTRTRARA
ncbi:hypothetical protein ACFSQE_03525 [Vogesella fluminis]|uniref:hypothetical protein n=1 Tax=Vogesella fluminis TaxID=1069161 RepID=UPI0036421BFF